MVMEVNPSPSGSNGESITSVTDQNASINPSGSSGNNEGSPANCDTLGTGGEEHSNSAVNNDVANDALVVNELLCYVTHYMNSSSPENIKKIVLNFFSADEIIDAKKLIWSETNIPHLKKFQLRKTTHARHCSEANMNDILEALSDLDKVDHRTSVRYVAFDLQKVPNVKPEKLNEVSMLVRLELLEKKMSNIENNLSENAVQTELVSTSCKSSAEQLKTHEQLIESLAQQRACASSRQCKCSCSADSNSTRGTLGDEGSVEAVVSAEDINHGEKTSDETGDDDDEDETEDSDDSEDGDDTEDVDDSSDADSVEGDESEESSSSTEADSSSDTASADESVAAPRSKRKMKQNSRLHSNSRRESTRNPQWHSQRSPRSDQQRGPRHRPLSRDLNHTSVVTGNGHHNFRTSSRLSNRSAVGRNSDGFRIPRQHWKKERRTTASLFVFNVPNGCTANDIRDYVTDRSLHVNDIFQRSHPEARRKSFVLRISESASRRVMNPSFWPSGIKIRAYEAKSDL